MSLAGYGGLAGKKLEIMWNIRYFHPFPVKESLQLEFTNHLLVERRTVDDLLILQVAGQVNTVVFADIHHRLRRKLMLIIKVGHKYLLFWYSVYNMFFCSFYLKIVLSVATLCESGIAESSVIMSLICPSV